MLSRFLPLARSHSLSARSRRRPALESIEARIAPAVVVGSVFVDANGDGVQQTTEHGLAGVTVYIDLNNNGKFDPANSATAKGDPFAVTNTDGRYAISTSAIGSFTVAQVVPAGYMQTTKAPGPVTIGTSTAVQGPVFGDQLIPPPPPTGGIIYGSVFVDANGDGIRQSSETGDAGVLVFIDADGNGKFTPPNTTISGTGPGDPYVITGANGTYEFKVAKDGDYPVMEVTPTGWTQTAPNPAPGPVHVAGGAVSIGPLFGNESPAPPPPTGGIIHGSVFVDANGDGIRETTEANEGGVLVFIDANGDGKFTPPSTASGATNSDDPYVITGADGTYSFKVPKDGDYQVLEVTPTGWTQTAPSPAPGPVHVAGGATVAGPLFGNEPPIIDAPGAVSGEVFFDANGNGKLDPHEVGVPQIRVYNDANGNGKYDLGEASTITGPEGRYTLPLAPGQHSIKEVIPPGAVETVAPGTVTVTSGHIVTGANFGLKFGNVLPPVSLAVPTTYMPPDSGLTTNAPDDPTLPQAADITFLGGVGMQQQQPLLIQQ